VAKYSYPLLSFISDENEHDSTQAQMLMLSMLKHEMTRNGIAFSEKSDHGISRLFVDETNIRKLVSTLYNNTEKLAGESNG